MYDGMSVCLWEKHTIKRRMPKWVRGIKWSKHAHAQSQLWAVETDLCHPYYSLLYAIAALARTNRYRAYEPFTPLDASSP